MSERLQPAGAATGKDGRTIGSVPATNSNMAAMRIGMWTARRCWGPVSAGIAHPVWTGLLASGSSTCAPADDNPPTVSLANRFHRPHA
ncbi:MULTISPECIES: hypothetical protein [Xanthomonas]|uniref:Uncharacterized protein n=1 Tax=Xanthomonas dyei TaxID=743699 RepID=A0ABZ0D6Y0_9XANT|nr:hypothetical protein [Xanthomonas dyei]MCC4632558.1 hypothetical protein [Xanthomonas dyei pv. eucalypti]WOB26038.1 hypothetical protein NYR99_20605 [Xanthomonas dyei]WOB53662.1 hypothetical protein NYR95_20610 [Xanthomonas dyei]